MLDYVHWIRDTILTAILISGLLLHRLVSLLLLISQFHGLLLSKISCPLVNCRNLAPLEI
ncbi:hypothetical protein ACJIZ3_019901 [Penstemon smallii]|uniref:Uncharacterized protein n=1 Tax=Penstemon smallii TaxID=265156 RepID=A0ABD3T2G8_9LAMI